jgi:hypothetical protein
MSADTDVLVFDMSSQSEGTPSIFVKKDWLSILDNQNQNYQGNQCIIDTSQLANSNKYMSYRESYLSIPLLITATATNLVAPTSPAGSLPATVPDFAFGLKNWLGTIVHSITLDYNGTTIIQQTPYQGLWNCFRLLTSLSYNDEITQYSTIGFWKDNALTFSYNSTLGVSNNNNFIGYSTSNVTGASSYEQNLANEGLYQRQLAFAYDPISNNNFNTLIPSSNAKLLYKTQVISNQVSTANSTLVWQQAIMGTIYLKHLHHFFDKICLLKGVLMRFTLNLNQSSVSFSVANTSGIVATYSNVAVTSPLGGVSPLMIANGASNQGGSFLPTGNYTVSLAVGKQSLQQTQYSILGYTQSPLSPSITLNVPAYTFAPMFETSYLSSPVKKIVYSDIYQYSVPSISAGQTFNQLISNGIANIKSVLLIPFYTQAGSGMTFSPILSPLDTAGGGTTSPLCLIGNFQVQISGQNMLYNQYQYTYNEWLQQLYGCNSVNGGQTDGLSSGLLSQVDFETLYNYYYVDCSRMLAVEELVPKSIQILGQNFSTQAIQLFVFVNYGVEISLDILTGARV